MQLFNSFRFVSLLSLTTLSIVMLNQVHAEQKKAKPATPIIAAHVLEENLAQPLILLGELQAKEHLELKSNISDYIEAIHFDDGQFVEKGQLLVSLRADEERQAMKRAKILAAEAERQYRRAQKLIQRGNVTQATVDELKAAWESAVADLQVLKATLKDFEIRAPFSGTLGFRQVSPGALITTNQTIATLDDTQHLLLNLQIPSHLAEQVRVGQSLKFQPQTLATQQKIRADQLPTYQAKVSAISQRMDNDSRLLPIRAAVANPNGALRSGQLVRVTMELQPNLGVTVPNTALLLVGEKSFVYKINVENPESLQDKTAEYTLTKTKVTLGQRLTDRTEIISGLKPNELIVSQGILRISPKSQVKIKGFENDSTQEQLLKGKLLKVPAVAKE